MATKKTSASRKSTPPPLRPIGVTDDGAAIVLARRSGAKTGAFRLPINAELVEQLEAAEKKMKAHRKTVAPKQPAAPPPPKAVVVSKLTPKEVQALLRQGKSVGYVARKAGVDEAWVERFESPIIWERSGMATRAQRLTLTKYRSGPSALPMGESVRANLKARRVPIEADQLDEAFDAVRHPRKKTWIVSFSFTSRGRTRTARWEYDPAAEKLQALDKLAVDLGWVSRAPRRKSA